MMPNFGLFIDNKSLTAQAAVSPQIVQRSLMRETSGTTTNMNTIITDDKTQT